jgi:flagellar biosynthesis protein FlhG
MRDQANKLREIVNKVNNDNIETSIESLKTSAKVITVTSGKGGVGKTNVTINLAIALSKLGYRVVVIDADLGLANIDVVLGIMPKYSLVDIIKNGKNVMDVLTTGPNKVKFISGGSGVEELTRLSQLELENFVRNIGLLDKIADVILIDTGAGISENVLRFAMAADDVVVVTTPEPTATTDAYALIKAIGVRNKNKTIRLLVNKTETAIEAQTAMQKLNNVAKKFLQVKLSFLGYISNDPFVSKAVKQQKPFAVIYPECTASKNLNEIAKKIMQEPTSSGKNSGIKGFFNKFFSSNDVN